MKKLTEDEIRKIALLARLGLSEVEVKKLQGELSSILEYVEQLGNVNTDGVEPTSQVTGLTTVIRPDVVGDLLADPDELLKCSSQEIESRHIKVRSVFS